MDPTDPFDPPFDPEAGSIPEIFNNSGTRLPLDREWLRKLTGWLEREEGVHFRLLEVVYVDEDEIAEINRKYLSNDYITDIITFRYDQDESLQSIEGTLYCCAPRIVEQASELNTSPEEEFRRVYIHGLLHLAGYEDKSKSEKGRMRQLEDHYLDMS